MLEFMLGVADLAVALCGVLVIIYSVGKALYLFYQGVRSSSIDVNKIRLELGYGVILGLEFTVAADIIRSIAKPNFYDLGLLGGLVLIRTFLSYFLNKELESLTPERRNTMQI